MNLSTTAHGNAVEIGLNGRLDAASSAGVLEALNAQINAGHLNIILDFSRMDYISSSGLRVLLIAVKSLDAKSGRMLIHGMNAQVREVFDLAGFLPYFPTYASLQEALESLKKE